jgi:uncharacterized protein (DUF736 family)
VLSQGIEIGAGWNRIGQMSGKEYWVKEGARSASLRGIVGLVVSQRGALMRG